MKEKIIEIINRYWSFDAQQHHTHTWHDKQDCIKEIMELKIPESTRILPSNCTCWAITPSCINRAINPNCIIHGKNRR